MAAGQAPPVNPIFSLPSRERYEDLGSRERTLVEVERGCLPELPPPTPLPTLSHKGRGLSSHRSAPRLKPDRPLPDDREVVALKPHQRVARIGQQDHVMYAQLRQDLRAHAVIALLRRKLRVVAGVRRGAVALQAGDRPCGMV